MRRAQPSAPLGPIFEVAELVELLNSVSRANPDGRPRWNRHNVLRLLRKRAVRMVEGEGRGKLYVTLRAFREAFGDLWDSVLDCAALQDAA